MRLQGGISHDSPVLSSALRVLSWVHFFYYSNGDINCDISYYSIVSFDDDTILYHGISNVDDILQNDLYLYMIWLLVII